MHEFLWSTATLATEVTSIYTSNNIDPVPIRQMERAGSDVVYVLDFQDPFRHVTVARAPNEGSLRFLPDWYLEPTTTSEQRAEPTTQHV